jgi:hypothetical protein
MATRGQGKSSKLCSKIEGAFKIASQRRGDLLKVMVDPDAETIEEASRVGNDGSGLKGGLVDLHEEVEVRVGVFNCGGIILEVFILVFEKEIAVAGKPGREKAYVLSLELRSLVGSEGSVGCSVGEVIAYGEANVGVAFDKSWAQVFITINDKEVCLSAKIFKGVPMRERHVGFDSLRAKELMELDREL